jgi:hypothetical protein
MRRWCTILAIALLLGGAAARVLATAVPTADMPLVVSAEKNEVQVFGLIHPTHFNTARSGEAHYHLLVWRNGTSPNALIETPADDLAFHDALLKLGGQPGDNLAMAAWNERHDEHSTAPHAMVTGSPLYVRLSWEGNPTGILIDQAFRRFRLQSSDSRLWTLDSRLDWRFGGNRDRWFNRIPLAPRPGCLVCLYSCPSGKVSNGALSIHDYVTAPSRFEANADILPPDGTPVIVTFRLLP